nr:phage tail domain-containing protein [Staphylococcus pseudintermedius]
MLTPEQKNNIGNVSLEFVTTHLPFAESVETSLDLHKQLINGFWASDDDIDFDDTAKQTYIFNNVLKRVKFTITVQSLTSNLTCTKRSE